MRGRGGNPDEWSHSEMRELVAHRPAIGQLTYKLLTATKGYEGRPIEEWSTKAICATAALLDEVAALCEVTGNVEGLRDCLRQMERVVKARQRSE